MVVNTVKKTIVGYSGKYDVDITATQDFLEGLFEIEDITERALCFNENYVTVKEIKSLLEKIVNIDFLLTKSSFNWLINLQDNDKIYAQYYDDTIVMCYINDVYVDAFNNFDVDASLIYCSLKSEVYTINQKRLPSKKINNCYYDSSNYEYKYLICQ